MGFLDTIKENLSSVLPVGDKVDKSAIGLDVGTSSIKVVQLRREKGKALLETYGEISVGPYASIETGKATHIRPEISTPAIRDLLREANVVSINAGMSIPFSAAMTRVIKVPRLSKEQLNKIIPIEARKFIPMPLNEVVLNWFVLPDRLGVESENNRPKLPVFGPNENKVAFQEALIVAIHKDAVSNMQAIARQTDLQVAFYELETFSSIRSSVEYELAPTMFLDLGATTTKIYVVEAGLLRFSHLVNLGSQNITENLMRSFTWPFEKAERLKKEIGLLKQAHSVLEAKDKEIFESAIDAATNRIFTEVNRVLINYEKKNNKPIVRVGLGGGGANLPGVVEYAANKLAVDVQKADPFSKVHTPAFLNEVLKDVGPDFTVAVGLALRRLGV